MTLVFIEKEMFAHENDTVENSDNTKCCQGWEGGDWNSPVDYGGADRTFYQEDHLQSHKLSM